MANSSIRSAGWASDRAVCHGESVTYSWFAFLTDYGTRDGFVASCHGVMARIAPAVRAIDITHEVPPRDVRHGAAVLAQTVPYLPPSVVVAVVDPGVGTSRRAIAVRAGESVLVGPDNGLLGWAADALGGAGDAVELTVEEYLRRASARTFDGRDVFAPAAAHIAAGVPVENLGPPVHDLVRLPDPYVAVEDGTLRTEVLTVDHFGNVQLAATAADLAAVAPPGRHAVVGLADRHVVAVVGHTFADAPAGQPVLYVDSAGHLALAVNRGDASALLGLGSADPVTIAGE
jgi:S-adenosyl-L-methionine hydrolase (adenosine-forming)